MQNPQTPATAGRYDTAIRAPHQLPGRGDGHREHPGLPLHGLDLDTLQAEQRITAGTGIVSGRAHAPRILGQR